MRAWRTSVRAGDAFRFARIRRQGFRDGIAVAPDLFTGCTQLHPGDWRIRRNRARTNVAFVRILHEPGCKRNPGYDSISPMKRYLPLLAGIIGVVALLAVLPLYSPAESNGLRLTRSDAERIADDAARKLGIHLDKTWSTL